MKKSLLLLLTGLLITIMTQAQTPETLSNGSIIKMSKAKLSEELIIDMITTSPVKFDLSENAINNLMNEGVSPKVIETMKVTGSAQNSAAITSSSQVKKEVQGEKRVVKPEPLKVPEPQTVPDESADVIEAPAEEEVVMTIEAMNYVDPLLDLVKFNENELNSFEQTIKEWDKQVKNNISEVNKAKGQILQMENELRQKKNSDTKAFSDEVISLKGKLDAYRGKYEQSKAKMVKEGLDIVKKLETIKSERLRNLGKAFSDASQSITGSETNPANGEKAVSIDYTKRAISPGTTEYIVSTAEMLAWYQNEVLKLNEIINNFNPRVTSISKEDNNLRKKLEPLEARLLELKPNAKQNKTEIAGLKKQVSEIEKERKKLADRMKDDCKELSDYIKKVSQEDQEAVKERFDDIIENINYSFQEKLSL